MSTYLGPSWDDTITNDNDVSFGPDCLDRAKYAYFLTRYLEEKNRKTDKPYVLNLNSGWGTGKSYFLNRWMHDIRKKHPVIYIDIWKDDHSGDPLMSVVSGIISQLQELTDKKKGSTLDSVQKLSERFIKEIAPVVVGGVVKKITGISFNDFKSDDSNPATDSSAIDSNEIDRVAQKMTNTLISEYDKRASSIESMKKTMKEWIEAVIGQNTKELGHPTFIIIDELDRCRPNHAVETLEVVKHIFDIPGVFFIVATDTEQLQHAIKAVYGHEFDAKTYLSRFFDTRFTLPTCSLEQMISSHCEFKELEHDHLVDRDIKVWPVGVSNLKNISSVLDAFKIPARNAIQITERVISVVDFLNKDDERVDLILLTTLFCFQFKYGEEYDSIIGQKITYNFVDFSHKYDAMLSGDDIELRVYSAKDSGQDFHETIKLSSYYDSVFKEHLNIFVKENTSFFDIVNGLKRGGSEYEIYMKAKERYQEAKRSLKDSAFEREVASISYFRYGMEQVNMNKYINLIELAISFD